MDLRVLPDDSLAKISNHVDDHYAESRPDFITFIAN